MAAAIPLATDATQPEGIGRVLAGEYIFFDFNEDGRDGTQCAPLDLKTLHRVRDNPRCRAENMRCTAADAPLVTAELHDLQADGSDSQRVLVVDLSTANTGRNIDEASRVAKNAGVAVLCSTGHHLHPPMCTPRAALPDYTETMRAELGLPPDEYTPRSTTPPRCGVITCSPHTTLTPESIALLRQCAAVGAEAAVPVNVALPTGFAAGDIPRLLEVMHADGRCPPAVVLHNWYPAYTSTSSGDGGSPAACVPSVCGALSALLEAHPGVLLSFDYFGWGGLVVDGRHPFGHDVAPRAVAVQLLERMHAAHPGRVVYGTQHATKHCTSAWGGGGRRAVSERVAELVRSGHAVPSLAAEAYVKALAWWTPPKPKAKPKVYWTCDCCGGQNEEATPDRSFRKLDFRYCSIKCLKEHTPKEPEPEKERRAGARPGGGNGLGSWGVAMTR